MEHIVSAVALGMRVDATGKHETSEAANQRVATSEVERIIDEWDKAPRMTGEMLLERYGAPNEATPARLIWHQAGHWKRIVLTRDVYSHHFPMPHSDFLNLTIDYEVPLEKLADVVRFDGSVIVDRTAGEVTARCDSEAADIITLNLVHDIVTGAKSVDEARSFFALNAPKYNMGNSVPYMEQLQFELPRKDTEFLDEALVAKEILEKVKAKAKELMPGR